MTKGQARIDLASTGAARGAPQTIHGSGMPDSHAHGSPGDASCTPALAAVQRIVAAHVRQPGPLLPILHAVQAELGCIPPDTVQAIADGLNLSRAEVHGVITFYPHFRQAPAGRHVVELCQAESCQAMGSEQLALHARGKLGCDFHASSADGNYTLEPVYCLGLCAQSPAMMIDGVPYARLTPQRFDKVLGQVTEAAE
ncbi:MULTISPECIES: formate dehydrogenase subunit gamma [unclassified Achromobacter]|uniref:formate dehydrogenase subunit gamma n=1 Tax=unclassified Achromobacter TaxID=2626865 RepID=UPI000B518048|nr:MULTISPECIES: formate dehydrogenase subunit gamma [unclassified Achromobacter]OWT76897.1 formate dehydrogenase subunit gamma [Achromobacter sp. HZ28]OWT77777.1 formate dehydrogenase subunit gamma [Achromobacter sp. HZ34]